MPNLAQLTQSVQHVRLSYDASHCACIQYIEVKDSWMAYFIPARYGLGVWPDGELSSRRRRRRRHLEIQVNIQARKLYLEFYLWFWGCGERSRRMETEVLHRISMRVS